LAGTWSGLPEFRAGERALIETVYLGLGSNLGDRLGYLRETVASLASVDDLELRTCSSVYETEPVGRRDQPPFLNAVVELQTTLDPLSLLKVCQAIELELGRTRDSHWGPRTIDIDLLCYGEQVVDSPELRLPHPMLHLRRFVLVPFAEIAPEFVVPRHRRTVAELLGDCPDHSWVELRRDRSVLAHPELNGN